MTLKHLYNRKDKSLLLEELNAESFERRAASFYRYTHIENPCDFRNRLYASLYPLNVFGRIYVAKEGINAQLSFPEHFNGKFIETLNTFNELKSIYLNEGLTDGHKAFFKLTIKVKKKIVADGLDDQSLIHAPDAKHLDPMDFHQKLGESDSIVVDVRNDYECDTGHFENALCPKGNTFSQVLPELVNTLKPLKDKNILIYCTGGIRCEKAGKYFKQHGLENVFQLRGGILNYIRTVQNHDVPSKYLGNLFVFDGRMAEKTVVKKISHCEFCDELFDVHSDCANVQCHRLMLQCETCKVRMDACCSSQCQQLLNQDMLKAS